MSGSSSISCRGSEICPRLAVLVRGTSRNNDEEPSLMLAVPWVAVVVGRILYLRCSTAEAPLYVPKHILCLCSTRIPRVAKTLLTRGVVRLCTIQYTASHAFPIVHSSTIGENTLYNALIQSMGTSKCPMEYLLRTLQRPCYPFCLCAF